LRALKRSADERSEAEAPKTAAKNKNAEIYVLFSFFSVDYFIFYARSL